MKLRLRGAAIAAVSLLTVSACDDTSPAGTTSDTGAVDTETSPDSTNDSGVVDTETSPDPANDAALGSPNATSSSTERHSEGTPPNDSQPTDVSAVSSDVNGAETNASTANSSANSNPDTSVAETLPDGGTAPGVWAQREYFTFLCTYRIKCLPGFADLYGGTEGCLEVFANVLAAELDETSMESNGAGWDVACIEALDTLACPDVAGQLVTGSEVQQSLLRAIAACVVQPNLECIVDENCWPGSECSGSGAACGECLPRSGTCITALDCTTGETCYAGSCVELRADGAECDNQRQCRSDRCVSGTCQGRAPLGADCAQTDDCAQYTWCSDGKCSKPGVEDAACHDDATYTCQAGLACHEGTCQPVGYIDVPVGELCDTTSACLPGAVCNGGHVCQATADACSAESHCAIDEHCNGECVPRLDAGETCTEDLECKSFTCDEENGVCVDVDSCL